MQTAKRSFQAKPLRMGEANPVDQPFFMMKLPVTGASEPAWLQPSVWRVRSPHGHLFISRLRCSSTS